jgi:hypothetical protein
MYSLDFSSMIEWMNLPTLYDGQIINIYKLTYTTKSKTTNWCKFKLLTYYYYYYYKNNKLFVIFFFSD